MIDARATIGELSATVPNATRVFEELGIDYCCGGNRALGDACAEAKLPVDEVVRALERAGAGRRAVVDDDVVDLIDHIVSTHHSFTRSELARMRKLAHEVQITHGARHTELATLVDLLDQLTNDLVPHMDKEERILFPYIVSLELGPLGQPRMRAQFGTVKSPIAHLRREHETTSMLLRAIRTTTHDLRAPADASEQYVALLEGLAALERDLHEHIHLENNVLFVRAIGLEEKAA